MIDHPFSLLDRLLIGLNNALDVVGGTAQGTGRPNPGHVHALPELSEPDKTEAARLLRVDHAGEVAAQGLYQGQAMVARNAEVAARLQRAADEENDHLAWCRERIVELGGRTSRLDPVWYMGSFVIGAAAGLAGDRWSLGFVVETERQVVRHLENHLARLPTPDTRSSAILEKMKQDEETHGTHASLGAAELPPPVKVIMTLASKVMTKTAYWI